MSSTLALADLLRIIVCDSHLVKIGDADDASTPYVVLRERKANMSVRVMDVPASSAIVRIGRMQHLKGIRSEGHRKKICDYLIVMSDGQKSWAVLVEMKKTLSGADLAKEQLRRSVPVVKYLQSLCEVDAEQPMQVVLRHVLLVEKTNKWIDKDRTRVTQGVELQKAVYKEIHVKTIVGTSVAVRQLVDD